MPRGVGRSRHATTGGVALAGPAEAAVRRSAGALPIRGAFGSGGTAARSKTCSGDAGVADGLGVALWAALSPSRNVVAPGGAEGLQSPFASPRSVPGNDRTGAGVGGVGAGGLGWAGAPVMGRKISSVACVGGGNYPIFFFS